MGQFYTRDAGFIVGLDIGGSVDFSAIAVLHKFEKVEEYDDARGHKSENIFHLESLWRLPLGMLFQAQLSAVQDVIRSLPPKSTPTKLVLDGSGLGKPVSQAAKAMGLNPVSVVITGGRNETSGGDAKFGIPKRNLVGSLLACLGSNRLKFNKDLAYGNELIQELGAFSMKINNATGHASFESSNSTHDDLVCSLALAVWYGDYKQKDYSALAKHAYAVMHRNI